MTYPTVGSTSKSQKDDINRIRSMSVQQRSSGTSQNITNHLHCFNNKSSSSTTSSTTTTTTTSHTHSLTAFHNQRNRIYLRNHVSRSRSKTVSGTDDSKLNKRSPSMITDADVNGNIGICNGHYVQREKLRRSSMRNYTRTDIDLATGLQATNGDVRDSVNKLKSNNDEQDVTIAGTQNVPSVKRNKRTLSSTHIEREKSDEKNIKLLRKNAVALRTLSPLMIPASTSIGANKTNKQLTCDEHIIGPTNKRSQSICTSLTAAMPQKSNATDTKSGINNNSNNNNNSPTNNNSYVALRLRKR